jgi:hypothetical protein
MELCAEAEPPIAPAAAKNETGAETIETQFLLPWSRLSV